MILEAVVLPVVPGQEADFEAAFAQASSIIASMKGYVGHELHRSIETPNHYLLTVQWETLEDHTVGFRQSRGVPAVAPAPAPLLQPVSGC